MVMASPKCTEEAATTAQEPVYGAPLDWEEVEQMEAQRESENRRDTDTSSGSYDSDSEDEEEFINEDFGLLYEESESDSKPEVQSPGKRQRSSSSGVEEELPDSGGWKTDKDQDVRPKQPYFCPRRPPGPQGLLLRQAYSVLEIFMLYISKAMLQVIVGNTNKFGRQQVGAAWSEICIEDMYSFLALVVFMGLNSLYSMQDYWKKSELYSCTFPKSVMSGRQFRRILSHLHLSDPDQDRVNEGKCGTPEFDRLGKIKPMYEQIQEACKAPYHPRQNIAVYERMVASQARAAQRQYMKYKPVKWGYKLFVLADSLNGYTWDLFVYKGKGCVGTENGIGYDTVMRLLSTQSLGTGYKLFVDNFYTSPCLFRDLLEKKIRACGTIRSHHIGYLKDRPGGLDRQSPRGSIRWIRDDDLLFVLWRDTRDVLMCSTVHAAHGGETVSRRIKGQDGRRTLTDVPVPSAVKDYNKHMGALHLSDTHIKYFNVLHKTMKWYKTFFFHFIDIAIVNAFTVHKEHAILRGEKPMTHKEFRETLVLELTRAGSKTAPAPDPAPASDVLHLPEFFAQDGTNGRRRCMLCGLKTGFRCSSCGVSLCLNARRVCFTQFHLKDKK